MRITTAAVILAVGAFAPNIAAQQRPRAQAKPSELPRAPARRDHDARPRVERRSGGHPDETPHVRRNTWFGHAAPRDGRFHLDHPFEHGRFDRVGPSHRFQVLRVDRAARRVWLPGGFGFEIAVWDWPYASAWCWDCGDNIIVYDDPDHAGWYLLFDVTTRQYVHAVYLGL